MCQNFTADRMEGALVTRLQQLLLTLQAYKLKLLLSHCIEYGPNYMCSLRHYHSYKTRNHLLKKKKKGVERQIQVYEHDGIYWFSAVRMTEKHTH